MSDWANKNEWTGKNEWSEKLPGVGCDVTNCVYHGKDDHCHAPSINVESHNALRKAETYCGTFEPKASM